MIISCKNLKIKEYLKLRDCKQHLKKQDRFVIEGVRLIFEAFKQKVEIFELFLTKKCEEKFSNGKYNLKQFKNFSLISEKVAKELSLVKNNQGAFAIVKKIKCFSINQIKSSSLVLALIKINNPINLGGLLRSAFCFGFLKVLLYNCCNVYNPKVVRASMGALFKLSFLNCRDFEEILNFLKEKKIKTYAATLGKKALCSKFLQNKTGVLILGNEAFGLEEKIIKKCTAEIKIKMLKNAESLNVACAGSILMYEMKNC